MNEHENKINNVSEHVAKLSANQIRDNKDFYKGICIVAFGIIAIYPFFTMWAIILAEYLRISSL